MAANFQVAQTGPYRLPVAAVPAGMYHQFIAALEHMLLTPAGMAAFNASARKEFSTSDVWTWVHGRGQRPIVQCTDLNGYMLDANPQHLDENTVRVVLSAAMSGFLVIHPGGTA